MILYFADRKLNIIGQASMKLPKGLTIVEDKKTEDVETGVAVFECTIPFNDDTRDTLENCASVGNYILRSYNGENEFYTIIDSETDTKKQEVYIYAEDAGLDLLNEIVGAYEADKAYSIEHYIQKFAYDSGFQIGVNQVASLTRKLSWDGEATVTERIASIATQFDGAEVSYSFGIDGMNVVSKYINIYKQRGKDIGENLRLNEDIDRIITKKTIMNLATCLKCTGGTPEDAENPINLSGYTYDDGDFFVDGQYLKSREAQKKWDRFTLGNGYIVQPYSYDTLSQSELCNRAISELKKLREMEVNYEVDIKKLPDNTKIGDRINIIDDAGNLYVSARVLKLETSAVNDTHEATLGEYLIKGSGISQKVADLAAQFAKNSASAARALSIANNAKATAAEAQAQASAAATQAENAQNVAADATAAANSATQSAEAAQQAASNAQAAVDIVEADVDGLKTTVANAQAAAEQAQRAAETAETKAVEAQQAATNAQTKANEAATAAGTAQSTADEAKVNAETAQNTAAQAIADAEEAATTAAAAKLDAENAQKDIDSLGESLTTLENTMSTDYARKTDLTKATASLQTQITQNAAEISSTATKVQEIDETANNAQEQAEAAQTAAQAAQTQADQAIADAQAAQTAADSATQAAQNAQSEADTAKAAAATAQSVADKAQADLEAAQADLATVTSRVDATEADITAAQQAVTTAQAAADKAKADATEAAEKAAEAQSTADTAVANAANAQQAAKDASDKATIAQATADAAKGDAAAAQATADEAKANAATAQATANTAKTNAASAQAAANQAAADAATAQQAANNADAKAAQAAADLATAQQNLADVTSRVDATEEEVAAAQQAVETAQAAADQAKTDAEAAQATADTAKANAATAQTAANNAKSAADNAQATADEAQAAADAAQADVDALAVRVTTAETKITQNSEAIELRATKTEVAETLGGYYTKTEADAAISVKADEITQNVSATYATKQEVEAVESTVSQHAEAIELRVTRTEVAETLSNYPTTDEMQATVDSLEMYGHNLILQSGVEHSNNNYIVATYTPSAPLEQGETYTVSLCFTPASGVTGIMIGIAQGWSTPATIPASGTGKQIGSQTFVANYNGQLPTANIANANIYLYRLPNDGTVTGNTTIHWIKVEKGSKATDYTAAPEDEAIKRFEALEVGGRNLLLKADFSGVPNMSNASSTVTPDPASRMVTVNNFVSGYTRAWDMAFSDYALKKFRGANIISSIEFMKTAEIELGTTNPFIGYEWCLKRDSTTGGSDGYYSVNFAQQIAAAEVGQWIKHTATKIESDYDVASLDYFQVIARDFIGEIKFRNFKVEFGNKPTDWTLAPEDVENALDEHAYEIESVKTEMEIMSDEISMNFTRSEERVENVNGELHSFVTQFSKYIKFKSETAIEIGSGDSAITLEIDNETGIVFKKNGVQFGWWDGTDFHTGNIVVEVNERAQLGNYAFIPRSDGSLMLLKVGG